MFADLFVLLYVGHLLADYVFQTDHQAAHKALPTATGWRANAAHAATHVVTCGLGLAAAGLALEAPVSPWEAGAALAWIGATHSVIDRRWPVLWWMRRTGSAAFIDRGGAAYVDQAAHVAALTAAALALAV